MPIPSKGKILCIKTSFTKCKIDGFSSSYKKFYILTNRGYINLNIFGKSKTLIIQGMMQANLCRFKTEIDAFSPPLAQKRPHPYYVCQNVCFIFKNPLLLKTINTGCWTTNLSSSSVTHSRSGRRYIDFVTFLLLRREFLLGCDLDYHQNKVAFF